MFWPVRRRRWRFRRACRNSLMARLDRLASVKEVAQIGATIGREFSYEVLRSVAERPDDQLRDAVDRLIAAGLIFRRGMPPHEAFIFKHAFVQDAAYGTLLRGRRQELHRAIAQVLERQAASPSQSESVAGERDGAARSSLAQGRGMG